MKTGFEGDLLVKLRKYPIDGKWFRLYWSFKYAAKNGNVYVVPAGINTDFASIPRGMRWLIPRVGDHGMAAVLHDWLCEFKIVKRKEADRLFLEAMEYSKVNWFKRRFMYFGVRAYSVVTFK
jgi:hypothetical protein